MQDWMMFHIYNQNHEPLCCGSRVLEFKHFADACRLSDELFDAGIDMEHTCIVCDALFWDGGYIDASDLTLKELEAIPDEEE